MRAYLIWRAIVTMAIEFAIVLLPFTSLQTILFTVVLIIDWAVFLVRNTPEE